MSRAQHLYERLLAGGEPAIETLIADRAAEELFLDFRRSADDGEGERLHVNDRRNLARAISGFGNSEGGVIVWGIDCRNLPDRGDPSTAKRPVANPARFADWLAEASSGCTLPAHDGVHHRPIETAIKNRGFVLSYVPKSHLAPHQCLAPVQYFHRAGSDFLPVPHALLAGMFGRSPAPQICHEWSLVQADVSPATGKARVIQLRLDFRLTSVGPGLARDMFVTGKIQLPGDDSELTLGLEDEASWVGHMSSGGRFSLVARDGVKLAPEMVMRPFFLQLAHEQPFTRPFRFLISYGHASSHTTRIESHIDVEELRKLFQASLSKRSSATMNGLVAGLLGPTVSEVFAVLTTD